MKMFLRAVTKCRLIEGAVSVNSCENSDSCAEP